MKLKLIVCLLVFCLFSVSGQERKKDLTSTLVSKGTFFTGFSSDLSFGYARPENRFLLPAQFKPKIGYFIFDRLSLVLSHQGIGLGWASSPVYQLLHTGELEMNYYFYTRKNFLFYSQTGLAFQQRGVNGFSQQTTTKLELKLGTGISYRLKTMPNLAVNMEAAYYIGSPLRTTMQKMPSVTFGLTYFFNAYKKKKFTPLQN